MPSSVLMLLQSFTVELSLFPIHLQYWDICNIVDIPVGIAVAILKYYYWLSLEGCSEDYRSTAGEAF